MKCIHCQAIMKHATAPLHIARNGCHVTLDNVPAWVCSQCGEAYFEENQVNIVQELIGAIEHKSQQFYLAA